MKSKPEFNDVMYEVVPVDTRDLFIDIKLFVFYREAAKQSGQGHETLMSGLGKNVFVFDVESCEILEEEER